MQRQEVVAGVDARAAVDDRLRRGGAERLVAAPQLVRRAEDRHGVGGEVAGPGRAPRARDVAGARVDRLHLAAVALGRPRVEDERARVLRDHLGLVDHEARAQARRRRRPARPSARPWRAAGPRPSTSRCRRRARPRRRGRERAAGTTGARRPSPRRRRRPRRARRARCPAAPITRANCASRRPGVAARRAARGRRPAPRGPRPRRGRPRRGCDPPARRRGPGGRGRGTSARRRPAGRGRAAVLELAREPGGVDERVHPVLLLPHLRDGVCRPSCSPSRSTATSKAEAGIGPFLISIASFESTRCCGPSSSSTWTRRG